MMIDAPPAEFKSCLHYARSCGFTSTDLSSGGKTTQLRMAKTGEREKNGIQQFLLEAG
jgi:hypothetical protein